MLWNFFFIWKKFFFFYFFLEKFFWRKVSVLKVFFSDFFFGNFYFFNESTADYHILLVFLIWNSVLLKNYANKGFLIRKFFSFFLLQWVNMEKKSSSCSIKYFRLILNRFFQKGGRGIIETILSLNKQFLYKNIK